jgi:hypothetical protein
MSLRAQGESARLRAQLYFIGTREGRLYPHAPRRVRPSAATGRMGQRVPAPPPPVGVAARFLQGTHCPVSPILLELFSWLTP